MTLLLFYLPSDDRKIHSHFLVPCHLSTTLYKAIPSQYPPIHASSPLWMKPLMLSFAPRIAWNQALPFIITLKFLAQSHYQISSPTSYSSAAPSMIHFSTHTWYLILYVNLCEALLSPTPVQGFIPLSTLLLDPHHGPKLENHIFLPEKGFALFQDTLSFRNGCKWFFVLVCHITYYYPTIAFQGPWDLPRPKSQ